MPKIERIQEARNRLKGRDLGRSAIESAHVNETKETLVISQGVFVDIVIDGAQKTFYVVESELTITDMNDIIKRLDLPEGVMLLRIDSFLGQELAGKTVGTKCSGRNGKDMRVVRVYARQELS